MRRRRFMNKVSMVEFNPDNYLTIESIEDGLTAKLSRNVCQYSTDGVAWTDLTADTETPTINAGEKLYFKATGLKPVALKGIGTFTVSKQFKLSGNCMSMLFGDEAEYNLDLTGKNYAFYKLFNNCTTLKSVSTGFLPATTLAVECYQYMFSKCTELTIAPELPATTLVDYCYQNMFYGCTGLTTAPELPATTLSSSCYNGMFHNCSNLITAPELPATTLSSSCYNGMFYGCSSLTTAPDLPAITLVKYCYSGMFCNCIKLNYIKAMFTTTPSSSYTNNWVSGVASTGTFVKNVDATWDVTGIDGVPSGWTITRETQLGIKIIEFTIDGTSYQAEEGMTWQEWVDSEYNIIGVYINDYNVVYWSSGFYITDDDELNIYSSEIIENNKGYYKRNETGEV